MSTPVVDPGLLIVGRSVSPHNGSAPTPDADAFRQKCMWKQKNWVPLGGGDTAPFTPQKRVWLKI